MKYKYMPSLGAIIACFVAWQIATNFIPNFLLPTPYVTIRKTVQLFFSTEFVYHAHDTLIKVIVSFTIAYMGSNLLAFLSRSSSALERFIKPFIFIGMQTPGLIAVYIAVVVMGTRGPVSIVITSLLLCVDLYNVLYPSYKNLKPEYAELSTVYRLSKSKYIIHVILPQFMPHQFSAIRLGVSLGWKLTLLTEIFTINNGVGYQIQRHFNLFSIVGVLSWFISFALVMLIIEYGIIRPLEKRLVYYPHANAI